MGARAPGLAGIFRSDTQLRMLGELAASGDKALSISELARRSSSPYSQIHREVERLLEMQLLEEEWVGRTRTVRLSDRTAYVAPLRQILLMTYGPLPALREALQDLPYVVHASIFGSWARRYAGLPGPPPQDVDLLVVFDASHPQFPEEDTFPIFQAIARANDRLPTDEINATLVPLDEWNEATSAFLQQVRDEPRVAVIPKDDAGRMR